MLIQRLIMLIYFCSLDLLLGSYPWCRSLFQQGVMHWTSCARYLDWISILFFFSYAAEYLSIIIQLLYILSFLPLVSLFFLCFSSICCSFLETFTANFKFILVMHDSSFVFCVLTWLPDTIFEPLLFFVMRKKLWFCDLPFLNIWYTIMFRRTSYGCCRQGKRQIYAD